MAAPIKQTGPRFYRDLWDKITLGRVWRREITNRRKDGSSYTEEQTITPVRIGEGEITNYITIKQDITERNELQNQLAQAQKMEAVGQLTGGIAHDFNNLLTPVLGYASLAAKKSGRTAR